MEFERILRQLIDFDVEFVLIGGLAAAAQGSIRPTYDIDLCYRRTPENLERTAAAFAPLHPSLRGAPEGLPFLWDARTLQQGMNFTLDTNLGALDLRGEVAGLGSYEQVLAASEMLEIEGMPVQVLTLEGLIAAKRAAGRPKDLEQLLELEALAELRSSTSFQGPEPD